MMKRLPAVSAFALALLLLQPMPVSANMAAPKDPDVGTSIIFQQNDALTVTEEVLDITVTGSTADITAAYSMRNLTTEPVSTPVMFLAPNTGDGSVEVTVNGEAVPFSMDTYTLSYYRDLEAEDWRYAMLHFGSSHSPNEEELVGISFQLDFEPEEAGEIVVSYPYRLGGYPDYIWNAKRGEILYYLAPAALWEDVQSLTINLYLDNDMPVVTQSSVPFEKVGSRTYQYRSDSLPKRNLEIEIDQNQFQEAFSTLLNPYLLAFAAFLVPPLLVVIGIMLVIELIWKKVRSSKGGPPK